MPVTKTILQVIYLYIILKKFIAAKQDGEKVIHILKSKLPNYTYCVSQGSRPFSYRDSPDEIEQFFWIYVYNVCLKHPEASENVKITTLKAENRNLIRR